MTAGARTTFNLIDEQWIPIRDTNGQSREVSLRDLLVQAHNFASIGGELPTHTFAIARIALAVVRSAIGWTKRPVERWHEIWRVGALPIGDVEDYLDRVHDRFDLLDPLTPFYQVADFETTSGAVKSVELLITDIPAGEKYFTTRAGDGAARLDFAEAARWVVHCQTFDQSGIKSGDPRDPRTRGGKGYPIGIAWGGQLGGVLFEGGNLFETLMLNTVLRSQSESTVEPTDTPVWEREHPDVTERSDVTPLGIADILTWQSRRIRLQHNGTFVTGAVIGNGDKIASHNQQRVEFMTQWRFSDVQSKKFNEYRYFPRQFDPDRALWRGIESLLADIPDMDGRPERGLAPGVVHWIDYLVNLDILPRTLQIRPHALALQYINQSSVIGASVDDVLTIKVALIDRNSQARVYANRAVQVADDCVTALVNLASNLAAASGGDAERPRATTRSETYFALDGPYRNWLAALDDDSDVGDYFAGWQFQVRGIVGGRARELIASAGEPAWKGRMIRDRWLDSSLASGYFWSALRKTIPAAFDTGTIQKGVTL